MSTTFRVASFNAENLFSRARILNLADNTVVADALAKVDQLNKLLAQETYTPAIKKKILALHRELNEYIRIRENRGKLFNRRKTEVVAGGASDWDGGIEFKRERFSELTRANTAKVIKAVKADVACIVESEDRPALVAFNSDMLASRKFKYAMLIDGNDQRGIDVGVLSNFPILDIKTHIYDGTARSRTFSRDCLRVELELSPQRRLHLLVNHFKSKSGGAETTDARRLRQSARVAEILGEYDLTSDLVIVAGDFNDTPAGQSLQPLLTLPHLHDVLALQFPSEPQHRWTYHFQTNEQIDFLLVSDPLKDKFVQAGVERRGIHDLATFTGGAETQFPTVTAASNAASDHGAVWAEFEA
jgi:endonuclease/exonuclease/phosphatase family metal-dependent hydrolase